MLIAVNVNPINSLAEKRLKTLNSGCYAPSLKNMEKINKKMREKKKAAPKREKIIKDLQKNKLDKKSSGIDNVIKLTQ